jgi:hypothetical protein
MIQVQAAMICCICNTQFTLHTRVQSMESVEQEVHGCPCPKCNSTATMLFNPNPPEDDPDPADAWKQGG